MFIFDDDADVCYLFLFKINFILSGPLSVMKNGFTACGVQHGHIPCC